MIEILTDGMNVRMIRGTAKVKDIREFGLIEASRRKAVED